MWLVFILASVAVALVAIIVICVGRLVFLCTDYMKKMIEEEFEEEFNEEKKEKNE